MAKHQIFISCNNGEGMPTLILKSESNYGMGTEAGLRRRHTINDVVGICQEAPVDALRHMFGKYEVQHYKSLHTGFPIQLREGRADAVHLLNCEVHSAKYPAVTDLAPELSPYLSEREHTREQKEALVTGLISGEGLVHIITSPTYVVMGIAKREDIFVGPGPHVDGSTWIGDPRYAPAKEDFAPTVPKTMGGEPTGTYNYFKERKHAKARTERQESQLQDILEVADALLGITRVEDLETLYMPNLKRLEEYLNLNSQKKGMAPGQFLRRALKSIMR